MHMMETSHNELQDKFFVVAITLCALVPKSNCFVVINHVLDPAPP
jgi:hypothetical protein